MAESVVLSIHLGFEATEPMRGVAKALTVPARCPGEAWRATATSRDGDVLRHPRHRDHPVEAEAVEDLGAERGLRSGGCLS